jgi:hypothetical protein
VSTTNSRPPKGPKGFSLGVNDRGCKTQVLHGTVQHLADVLLTYICVHQSSTYVRGQCKFNTHNQTRSTFVGIQYRCFYVGTINIPIPAPFLRPTYSMAKTSNASGAGSGIMLFISGPVASADDVGRRGSARGLAER